MKPFIGANESQIFRLFHKDNFEHIIDQGLRCRNLSHGLPYREIGLKELIDKRSRRIVSIAPGGTLSDYVPFYFTPSSLMLYQIHTGHNVPYCANKELIFAVSSLHHLRKINAPFIFTDRHAYLAAAEYYDSMEYLDKIDWVILRQRDFKGSPEDPEKKERYMAEALVHKHVPLHGLLGFACYDVQVKDELERSLRARNVELPVLVKEEWYFQ